MVRRVFYFAGYRLKVFEWEGKHLLGTSIFEPTEAGFAEFERYLTQATEVPCQFLVDLIEEDFRRELIPHVSASDRKVLVARLLDRLYRGEAHVQVSTIGRSNEGRRDDILLFSALTNSDILAPWLTRFAQHRIPLAGIWSLPLLSTKLLSVCTDQQDNILLLSKQIHTAHRESYFKDGQLLFSRQAKLERDKRDQISAASAASTIVKGSEQIRIFLTNQRTMGYGDKLYVYCILPADLAGEIRALIKDTAGIVYCFVPLAELFTRYKLAPDISPEADTLFSYLCASVPLTADHYAQPVQKKFFRRYQIDQLISKTTVLVSMLVVVGASLMWLNALELKQQKHALLNQRQLLEQRYQAEYVPIQAALDEAGSLQASVEFARRLQQEGEQSPEATFAALSKVYSDPQFEPVHLTGLLWKKHSPAELQELLQLQLASVSEPVAEPVEPEALPETAGSLQPTMLLKGYLARGDLSYRDTVVLMERFAQALRSLPDIAMVIVLKMPVDVRPPLTFTDDAGARITAADQQKERENNRYEILLALPLPPSPVELPHPE